MQSLVPSLSLNNLIPFTIFFSFVFLSLDKKYPSRLTKTGSLRIAKLGPLRIGENKTPPNWQNWDPSELAKIRPLQTGKVGTPPVWEPSGFVKLSPPRRSKFSPDTLPDTFPDAIMLFELTRKAVCFPKTLPDWS